MRGNVTEFEQIAMQFERVEETFRNVHHYSQMRLEVLYRKAIAALRVQYRTTARNSVKALEGHPSYLERIIIFCADYANAQRQNKTALAFLSCAVYALPKNVSEAIASRIAAWQWDKVRGYLDEERFVEAMEHIDGFEMHDAVAMKLIEDAEQLYVQDMRDKALDKLDRAAQVDGFLQKELIAKYCNYLRARNNGSTGAIMVAIDDLSEQTHSEKAFSWLHTELQVEKCWRLIHAQNYRMARLVLNPLCHNEPLAARLLYQLAYYLIAQVYDFIKTDQMGRARSDIMEIARQLGVHEHKVFAVVFNAFEECEIDPSHLTSAGNNGIVLNTNSLHFLRLTTFSGCFNLNCSSRPRDASSSIYHFAFR